MRDMRHVEYAKDLDGNWTWVLVADDGSVSGQADNNLSSKDECITDIEEMSARLCTAHAAYEVPIGELPLRRIGLESAIKNRDDEADTT